MIFRRKTFGFTGALLFAVYLSALPAHAQPRPGPLERGEMGGDSARIALPLLLRGANLTADQKTQVQQIMANHRARLRDLFSQLRTAQDQMANKLFATGKLQEADLAPQAQQIAQLRNQLADEGLKVVLEIRGILTSEQLARASELKSQMQSLHTQMRSLWTPDRPER